MPDSFGSDALPSHGAASQTMQPAPVAPRNVQQRRNPVNHTDLASVLELIEEVDSCAHAGAQTSKLYKFMLGNRSTMIQCIFLLRRAV